MLFWVKQYFGSVQHQISINKFSKSLNLTFVRMEEFKRTPCHV